MSKAIHLVLSAALAVAALFAAVSLADLAGESGDAKQLCVKRMCGAVVF